MHRAADRAIEQLVVNGAGAASNVDTTTNVVRGSPSSASTSATIVHHPRAKYFSV